MKIVKTGNGPAVLTDDDSVVTPNDYAGMSALVKANPKIVADLVLALIADITAMIAAARDYKLPSAVPNSVVDALSLGVSAADQLRMVVEVASNVSTQEGE
jgi:hypothetical protein